MKVPLKSKILKFKSKDVTYRLTLSRVPKQAFTKSFGF